MLAEKEGNVEEAAVLLSRAAGFGGEEKARELRKRLAKDQKTAEDEPNNDILKATPIPLDKAIAASIEKNSDADYFRIRTPAIHRDWLTFRLENKSTTLCPEMWVYGPDKGKIANIKNGTPGANVQIRHVCSPKSTYYARVSSYFRQNAGQYALEVKPSRSYDRFEPNDTILTARKVPLGKTVRANIMDPQDDDNYFFRWGPRDGVAVLSVQNRSSTLKPGMRLHGPNKGRVADHSQSTSGGDLTYRHELKANTRYYVAIYCKFRDNHGAYAFSVRAEE
jgi:hypothetical protein